MKRYVLAAVIALGLLSWAFKSNPSAPTITLVGNSNFTHYGKPLSLTVSNPTGKELKYPLTAGQVYTTPNHQDLMITEDFVAVIAANSTQSFDIPSMCIQRSLSAPIEEATYQLAKSSEFLPKQAASLAQTELPRPDQQQVLWAMISDFDYIPYGMSDQTLVELNKIRTQKGLDPYTRNQPDGYEDDPNTYGDNPLAAPRRTSTFKGYFEVEYSRPHMTHIGLFDQNNILVQVILEEQIVRGHKKIEYTFNPNDYQGQTLYARLVIEGRVEMERQIAL